MRKLWTVCLCLVVFSMLTSLLPAAVEPVTAPGQQYADFTSQFVLTMQALGGVAFFGKVSLLITLVISSMKVSALNSLVWSRLGPAQAWVAPVLGLLAGVAGLGASGQPLSWPLVLAYATAGGGAVFVHEIMDSIKDIPGVGPVYKMLISWMESKLGGAKPPPPSGPTIASTLK